MCIRDRNTGAVRSKYTAVENLLGVYNLDMDGTLIITDGERVYSANDENINGKDVEDCDVISLSLIHIYSRLSSLPL